MSRKTYVRGHFRNLEPQVCPLCGGSGTLSCPTCEGSGLVESPIAVARIQGIDATCPSCKGNGEVICPVCRGNG